MKNNAISTPAAVAIIAVVVLVIAGLVWKFMSSQGPGPSTSGVKMMSADEIAKQKAAGPPPGPPLPDPAKEHNTRFKRPDSP